VRHALGGLALGLVLSGCAGEGPEPAVRPAAPAGAARPAEFSDTAWGSYRSKRFGLALPLPDAGAWRIDDRATQWLEASHEATGSELAVRMWHEDEIVNRDRCEARARGWRQLPPPEDIEVLRRDRVPVPPEYDTAVSVGVVAPRPGVPLTGVALAFGGWAHGCFAFVYRTTAAGPGAEMAIAARLAAIVDGTLAKLERQSDLAPEIPRDPAR
jgi:hypothetical protein